MRQMLQNARYPRQAYPDRRELLPGRKFSALPSALFAGAKRCADFERLCDSWWLKCFMGRSVYGSAWCASSLGTGADLA